MQERTIRKQEKLLNCCNRCSILRESKTPSIFICADKKGRVFELSVSCADSRADPRRVSLVFETERPVAPKRYRIKRVSQMAPAVSASDDDGGLVSAIHHAALPDTWYDTLLAMGATSIGELVNYQLGLCLAEQPPDGASYSLATCVTALEKMHSFWEKTSSLTGDNPFDKTRRLP